MAQPTAANMKWRPGADGAPTNPTDPIIGAIGTGSELVQGGANELISDEGVDVAGGTLKQRYGGAYASLEEGAGGNLTGAYLWLPNGARQIPSAGMITVTGTAANDGVQIRFVGLSGGVSATDVITVIAGTAVGTVTFDIGHWYWETVGAANLLGTEGTDDLSIKVGGVEIALIRAPGALYANGCKTGGSIFELAIANAFDEQIGAANNQTAPSASSGMTSYATGAILDGHDGSHIVGAWADGEYRGFAIRKNYVPGLQRPANGLDTRVSVGGTPQA